MECDRLLMAKTCLRLHWGLTIHLLGMESILRVNLIVLESLKHPTLPIHSLPL